MGVITRLCVLPCFSCFRNVSREIFEFMDMDDEIDTPPTKIPGV